ncbi:DUF3017 domain-containing protein [Actinocorallia longicatena]|uniref:DUF3017 family protein n=1 Tax=Actinocorallia longicatena TaxID=111803 RepID=A0ABP6QGM2_9ACTN
MTSGDRPGRLDQQKGRGVRRRRRTAPAPKTGAVQGWTAQAPYLVVLVGVLVGLIACFGSFKVGSFLMAASLIFGAVARGVMAESRVGFLATRRRTTDVIVLAVLGLGIGFLGWVTHAT